MKNIFYQKTHSTDKIKRMQDVIDELNSDLKGYKLDTRLRKAHFFAQVRIEAGPSFKFLEGLKYYRPKTLLQFSYYKSHHFEATTDGYIKGTHYADVETVCNKIYNDAYRGKKYKLGNTLVGDGYKYRGRGLKMVTGRDNYTTFNRKYKVIWGSDNISFVDNPELLEDAKYAVRSAIWFWLKDDLYKKASNGATEKTVNSITRVINRGMLD